MANVYSECLFAAVDKYVKGKMELFDDCRNGAIRTIMKDFPRVVKELMEANVQHGKPA